MADLQRPHKEKQKNLMQRIGLALGPVLFVAINLLDLEPGNPALTRMAAVAALMATWWITEAIPLFATALLPLILYPLLGIERGGCHSADLLQQHDRAVSGRLHESH